MNKYLIWEYYSRTAQQFGETQKTDENSHVTLQKQGYSLQFFYDDNLDGLISRAPLLAEFMQEEHQPDPRNDWNREIPSEEDIAPWLNQELGKRPYQNQIMAIRYALAKPLTLIQGPPGTGKTEMILNLLSVIHGLDNTKTVAVVSSNNEAINNITQKIQSDAAFAGLRDVYTQWGNQNVRKDWKKNHSTEEFRRYFYRNNDCFNPQLLTIFPLFSCTIHSMKKLFLTDEESAQGREHGNTQFDYVIIDEYSQVSTLLGLIAMSCAKEHLILIGDNEQLTPIVRENELSELETEYTEEDIPSIYRITSQNTFLTACEKLFIKDREQNRAENILLNEHFRCHPAIIDFCNKYIYNNQLVVRSENDGRFPLRVLWYEGEYSERTTTEYTNRPSSHSLDNKRQIQVFLQDEWPLLKSRIRQARQEGGNPPSICVISPYRDVLKNLKEALQQRIAEEDQNIRETVTRDLDIIEGNNEGLGPQFSPRLSYLTIHKSQGKGFDIICFLSACDYIQNSIVEEPWGQQRRMMNVTVSRAKKELHLITSNQWLPIEFQKKELGYVLPIPQNKEKYFFMNLLEYIYRELPGGNLQNEEFGFHRSQITSLFDRVPWYRSAVGRLSKD